MNEVIVKDQGLFSPKHDPIAFVFQSGLEQVSLSSPNNDVVVNHNSRYSRVPTSDLEAGFGSFSSQQHLLQQQQKLVHRQDQQLGAMSSVVGNIRNMSHNIGSELDEQAVMLDEFGTEIENADSKLEFCTCQMVNAHTIEFKLSLLDCSSEKNL